MILTVFGTVEEGMKDDTYSVGHSGGRQWMILTVLSVGEKEQWMILTVLSTEEKGMMDTYGVGHSGGGDDGCDA